MYSWRICSLVCVFLENLFFYMCISLKRIRDSTRNAERRFDGQRVFFLVAIFFFLEKKNGAGICNERISNFFFKLFTVGNMFSPEVPF